ncbi:hypothetical protein BgiMline_035012 [Biomphalaria glabrata]|nr:hypothetical protein BgiMline_025900 [Biomphalaria glabrata]
MFDNFVEQYKGVWASQPDTRVWASQPIAGVLESQPNKVVWGSGPDTGVCEEGPDTCAWNSQPDTDVWESKSDIGVWEEGPDTCAWKSQPDIGVWESKPDTDVWEAEPQTESYSNRNNSVTAVARENWRCLMRTVFNYCTCWWRGFWTWEQSLSFSEVITRREVDNWRTDHTAAEINSWSLSIFAWRDGKEKDVDSAEDSITVDMWTVHDK